MTILQTKLQIFFSNNFAIKPFKLNFMIKKYSFLAMLLKTNLDPLLWFQLGWGNSPNLLSSSPSPKYEDFRGQTSKFPMVIMLSPPRPRPHFAADFIPGMKLN